MSFDDDTRSLLAKMVAACRRRLTEDVTDQLRGVFGLHPDGTVLPLDKLTERRTPTLTLDEQRQSTTPPAASQRDSTELPSTTVDARRERGTR